MKPVLIVEDEAIMRESLRDWLRDEGFTVMTLDNGEQALRAIGMIEFGAMILDLRLPGKDGLQVLKEARAQRPQLKGIIITAYPSVETAVEAMKLGAVDYLVKPFPANALEKLLRETLGPVQVEIKPKAAIEEAKVEASVVEEVKVEEAVKSKKEIGKPGIELSEWGVAVREVVKPRECVWKKLGVVSYRLCTHDYDCLDCEFDQNVRERMDRGELPQMEEILRNLPGSRRLCRYALKNEVSFRTCSRLYQCNKCEFGQRMEDALEQKLANRQEAQHNKAQGWWWSYWGIAP